MLPAAPDRSSQVFFETGEDDLGEAGEYSAAASHFLCKRIFGKRKTPTPRLCVRKISALVRLQGLEPWTP